MIASLAQSLFSSRSPGWGSGPIIAVIARPRITEIIAQMTKSEQYDLRIAVDHVMVQGVESTV